MITAPYWGPASRLVFQSDEHRYFLDGREIPSNTTMIKAAGLIDDRWFTPESRQRGIEVHRACHFLCEKDLDWTTVRPDYVPYVEACQDFIRSTGFQVERNEFPAWSDHDYATTPDVMGILNGRRSIINFKTGAISKWVGLQLYGEKQAVNERIQNQDEPWTAGLTYLNGHPYPEMVYALELRANGKWKLHPFNERDLTQVFLSMVKLHHWNGVETPEITHSRLVLNQWKEENGYRAAA